MAGQKITTVQRDFSGGQIDARARRSDDLDLVRASCRTMKNCRSTSVRTARGRPGRRAHYNSASARVEYFRITPEKVFRFLYEDGKIVITDQDDTLIAQNTSANYLWVAGTVDQISTTLAGTDVVICFPEMRPQVASYNKDTDAWSFGQFTFQTHNSQLMCPFVRIGVPGASMSASGVTGSITLTCSQNYFTNAMTGRVLSILGRQVVLDTYSSATSMTANVTYQLSDRVQFGAVEKTTTFQAGMIAETMISKVKVEVGNINAGSNYVEGTMMSALEFSYLTPGYNDTLVSEDGSSKMTGVTVVNSTAQPVIQWAEEFMSAERGWPAKCFFTNNRLGFCDFPQQPNAILLSAIGSYATFWVDPGASAYNQAAGAAPSSAILEYAPKNARVKHVVDFGDLIVFTDQGVYSVPVSTSNPLKPGSIEFRAINADKVSSVPPVIGQDTVLYTNEGGNRVSAIVAVGQASRSYTSQDISDAHSSLISDPVCMVLATGDDTYPERMVYVVNSDGTIAAGRFIAVGGGFGVGWTPYESEYPVRWAHNALGEVHFIVQYGSNYIAEVEDDNYRLDSAMLYNDIPAGMVNGSFTGPVWWLAGESVTVMDGERDLGEREVDVDGALVPIGGEDFTSDTLVVGTRFRIEVEPFVPNIQAGEARGQRQASRMISGGAVVLDVSNGVQIGRKEFPAYLPGEDMDGDPPVREAAYPVSNIGAAHDPRFSIIKDRPGHFELLEITLEVSI